MVSAIGRLFANMVETVLPIEILWLAEILYMNSSPKQNSKVNFKNDNINFFELQEDCNAWINFL